MLSYPTTHLSPFNKFGCVSIREVYWTMRNKLGKDNGVIRQLFWRDFFYNLSHFHPEIYVESALNPKYRHIKWKTDPTKFKAWCEAKTGFPVVDACMRELNTTGYIQYKQKRGKMKIKKDAGNERNPQVASKFILANLIQTKNGLANSGLLLEKTWLPWRWRFL